MHSDFRGQVVTVFGGTGFLGRYIVAQLAEAGAQVKVVTRHPQSAYFLRICGSPGQVVAVSADYSSPAAIDALVKGSFAVVNCLGILNEKGKKSSFAHLHTDIPAWISESCARQRIFRFIHISALGVDQSSSEYAISKFSGENLARAAFPGVTILRPSVVFGAEDNFFNMFARMAQFLPALPLIGGGKTRFQPVYVGDIAKAVVAALGDHRSYGQTFELGGPEIFSFKQILQKLFVYTGKKRCLLPLPFWLARIQAFFMAILPNPPLTNDQITSLQTDSVVKKGMLGFDALGITPTAVDTVVPSYVARLNYTPQKD